MRRHACDACDGFSGKVKRWGAENHWPQVGQEQGPGPPGDVPLRLLCPGGPFRMCMPSGHTEQQGILKPQSVLAAACCAAKFGMWAMLAPGQLTCQLGHQDHSTKYWSLTDSKIPWHQQQKTLDLNEYIGIG